MTTILQPTSSTRTGTVRRWSGRIGAVAAAGLALIHLVVNAIGFVLEGGSHPVMYVLWGLLPSVVAGVIAVAAWRHADGRLTGGAARAAQVIVIVSALIFAFLITHQLVVTGVGVLHPIGPGLWSLVAAPALLISAVAPRRAPN